MRTGAAASHDGFFHELALFDCDEQLLEIVVPFVHAGISAGEPVLITFAPPNSRLLCAALSELAEDAVTFAPAGEQYLTPAGAIARYRGLFARFVAEGAQQIRVVGDVPHPGYGAPWDAWARYEAVANEAYREFPVWGMCPYDTRITPDDVLEDVARTHPHIATDDGRHHRNARYQDPRGFLQGLAAAPPDPLQATPPMLRLIDPTISHARHAVAALAAESLIGADAVTDLTVAVSETVSNAHMHGKPPVLVQAWATRDRVVVSVHDSGPGPSNPFVGLLPHRKQVPPAGQRAGGLGLWITHQLCSHVSLHHSDGFTIRLTAGQPSTPS